MRHPITEQSTRKPTHDAPLTPTTAGTAEIKLVFVEKDLVPEPSTNQIVEALEFSRLRFKLIAFLRLPSDIREPAFREVLERTCGGVYRNYRARAERVEKTLKSEDTLESHNTLEMSIRVPLSLDHRQGASLN
jgi:hypothetical protein